MVGCCKSAHLTLIRFKLKFSPDKVDTMIVQAIALLDDLDKEINIYSMRVKVCDSASWISNQVVNICLGMVRLAFPGDVKNHLGQHRICEGSETHGYRVIVASIFRSFLQRMQASGRARLRLILPPSSQKIWKPPLRPPPKYLWARKYRNPTSRISMRSAIKLSPSQSIEPNFQSTCAIA